MSNWQPARPADLPDDQQGLLRELREALGDLDHDSAGEGPVLVAPGTDGHIRLMLGPTPAGDNRTPALLAELVARRLADAGLRLTVDPQRLAEGYAVRVARRSGRPGVGQPVMIRFPAELLEAVDARAAAEGASRAATIRGLVAAGLDQPAHVRGDHDDRAV
jgi:hypothetical protein